MYKIGEFSKITGLSSKTLRYYDHEAILSPSFRNKENGYRYYNQNDFNKAQIIVILRSFDFSISEIKDVLANYESQSDLNDYLIEKTKLIEVDIIKSRQLIQQMQMYITSNVIERQSTENKDYIVVLDTIEPILVASMSFKGKYSEIGNYFKKVYEVVKDKAVSVPLVCYHDLEYKEVANIEISVPVSLPVTGSGVISKRLKEYKALCTTHVGEYEHLRLAYKAIFDYAEKNKLKCSEPIIEFYMKGPGTKLKGNPKKYITKIFIPIIE